MASWRTPRSAAAAAFARAAVTACAPQGAARARTLLWTCTRLAAWGERVGLAATPEQLLRPATLERYVSSIAGELSAATMRTTRANLRHVARHAAPTLCGPRPRVIGRDIVKAPYTEAQIGGYFEAARHQATPDRVARLTGLLCLGAERARRLRHAPRRRLRRRRALRGPGRRGRRTGRASSRSSSATAKPCGARRRSPARASSSAAWTRRGRTSPATSSPRWASAGSHAWRCPGCGPVGSPSDAARLGLPALMAAAGVRRTSRLVDLAAMGEAPGEDEVMARLGGV